eukprot:CFRG7123T1
MTDSEALTPSQVRMLQVEQQLIQAQFVQQKRQLEDAEQHKHIVNEMGPIPENTGLHGTSIRNSSENDLNYQQPTTSSSKNGKQKKSHPNLQTHDDIQLGRREHAGIFRKSGSHVNLRRGSCDDPIAFLSPNSTGKQNRTSVEHGNQYMDKSKTCFHDPRYCASQTSESGHLYVDPCSRAILTPSGSAHMSTPRSNATLGPEESVHLFSDPRSCPNRPPADHAHPYTNSHNTTNFRPGESVHLCNDPRRKVDVFPYSCQQCVNHEGVIPPDVQGRENGYSSIYGIPHKNADSTAKKPTHNPLSSRTRKAYWGLVIAGLLFWLIGLVGVSGSTSMTSSLTGGYNVLSRNHLRMSWFSFWLFAFLLAVTALVVFLRSMYASRAFLLLLWTICTMTLVLAADYALALNDQLGFVPVNETDLIKTNDSSYLFEISNYIVVTYIGAILMAVLSLLILFIMSSYDKMKFLR